MPLTNRQVRLQARRLTREGQAAHQRALATRQATDPHHPGTCAPLCPECEARLHHGRGSYQGALAALQAAVAGGNPARVFAARGDVQRLATSRDQARRDIAAITEAP